MPLRLVLRPHHRTPPSRRRSLQPPSTPTLGTCRTASPQQHPNRRGSLTRQSDMAPQLVQTLSLLDVSISLSPAGTGQSLSFPSAPGREHNEERPFCACHSDEPPGPGAGPGTPQAFNKSSLREGRREGMRRAREPRRRPRPLRRHLASAVIPARAPDTGASRGPSGSAQTRDISGNPGSVPCLATWSLVPQEADGGEGPQFGHRYGME